MTKKKITALVAVLLVAIVIIAGLILRPKVEATKESFIFAGESDTWQATLVVDTEITWTESWNGKLDHESKGERVFTISCKDDTTATSDAEEITIVYNCPGASSSSFTEEGPLKQEYTFSSANTNSAMVSADSEILVEVTLGNQVEQFALTNVQKG